jgi:hypothetical protein
MQSLKIGESISLSGILKIEYASNNYGTQCKPLLISPGNPSAKLQNPMSEVHDYCSLHWEDLQARKMWVSVASAGNSPRKFWHLDSQ